MDKKIKKFFLEEVTPENIKDQHMNVSSPKKKSKNNKDWWDSLSSEKQTEWIRKYPNGDAKKNIQSGEWTLKNEPLSKKISKNKENVLSTKEPINNELLKQQKEKAKKDRENLINGKFGRIVANPEELKELDKKRDKEEKEEINKGKKISNEKISTSYPTSIDGKDKTLHKIDTSKQKAFTETLYNIKKGDDNFYKKTINYEDKDIFIKDKWSSPSHLLTSGKVPIREVQIFTRMMNTKAISSTEPPISFFTDGGPGGAGKIQAQAGELMTMLCSSMSKEEKNEFKKSVLDHISKQSEKESIVTKDWLKAAINNSDAIHNRIEKEFGVDDASKIIMNSCWDTKDDVEALGLKDYKTNKGFSSDIYLKIKLPNGQEILNEVSLKKDKNVNFLNSATGKFKEWDKNLPKEIDINVYANNLSNILKTSVDKDTINRLLSTTGTPEVKELRDLLSKNKETTIDKFINGNNRSARKILLNSLKVLSSQGDVKAEENLKKIEKLNKDYALNSIRAIGMNEKLKNGMLNEIRSEFPLKAVTENEETMAIGDMSVDKKVIQKIFGTSKWDEIQERLDAVTDEIPPYIAYKAKGSKEIIPIAEIAIREDGVGYGASFKFEMKLDSRFAKYLKNANVSLYSKEKINENTLLYKWLMYNEFIEDD